MSIIRVGTTKKFADGWDAIFRGKKKSPAKKAARSAKKAGKKSARRKR